MVFYTFAQIHLFTLCSKVFRHKALQFAVLLTELPVYTPIFFVSMNEKRIQIKSGKHWKTDKPIEMNILPWRTNFIHLSKTINILEWYS